MDAESLVKELILKSMTPEQQEAILASVKTSVANARAVQKQKIGENVDIVVQALKKIESDIRSRYDDLGNLIEKRVASIADGRDGINGTDGRDGRDGKPGKDGAMGRQGAQGPAGKDGIDGIDGISVANAYLDFDGGLVITLSNGNEINVGEIVPMELASQIKVITNGGGTSQYVLDTLASLQTQINTLIPSQTGNSGKYLTTNGTSTSWGSIASGLSYQGTWNASTNSPTLASSTGTNGYYYIVGTAGSTNLNGITDWQIGDWLLFNGSVWQKIDQTNLVTSVAGRTGAVTLSTSDISGLGTIATQNANNVAITGGAVDGTTIGATTATTVIGTILTATTKVVSPYFDAVNSAGGVLRNASGTNQIQWGGGGGNNVSVDVSTNLNGSNAQIDISPTGTGHVHIKPTGTGSLEVAPTNLGTINNMSIGATTPSTGAFTSVTSTTPIAIASGGTNATTAAGALTSLGAYAASNPSGYTNNTGTVTSVAATVPTFLSVSGSPITTSGTLSITYSGTALPVANGGTGVTTSTGTGNTVLSTSPTLVTPILGTPTSATLTNATGLPISTGISGLGTGVATFLATPTSANLAASVTDETGTGSLVFSTSPTLITPALGTPSALVGTNITGTASGLTAGSVTTNANLTGAITSVGNATSLGSFTSANLLGALTDETGTGSAVFATSPTLITPILGTPTSATLTNATGLPISTGVSGLGTGVATFLATPTSANLAAALTDETGTGANVFATSPTLVTPLLGTPTSVTLTNATGLPLTTGVTGTLPVANGGTGTTTPSIVAGTNITVTGTWPNQTIAATSSSGAGNAYAWFMV
jgi:hypothetical protein